MYEKIIKETIKRRIDADQRPIPTNRKDMYKLAVEAAQNEREAIITLVQFIIIGVRWA